MIKINITFIAILLILVVGCTTPANFKEPITQLSQAATNTRIAVTAIMNEANNKKFQTTILKKTSASEQIIEADFTPVIPQEIIQLRARGLEMIEGYCVNLLQIVDSEAGAKAAQSLRTLGNSVKTYADTFQGADSSISRYAGPISELAAVTLDILDQQERVKMLQKALDLGIGKAQEIIDLLKSDFAPNADLAVNPEKILIAKLNDYEDQLKNRSLEVLAKVQNEFKEIDKLKSSAFQERQQINNLIVQAHNDKQMMENNKGVTYLTIIALEKSLEALQKLVNSTNGLLFSYHDEEEFAVFAAQLNTFSQYSIQLLQAVNQVKAVRRAEN